MNDTGPQTEDDTAALKSHAGDKFVYVMPEDAIQALASDEMTFPEIWWALWNAKWLIIGITFIFGIGSIVYALTATEWYRAEVVMVPAEQRSAPDFAGALGGLASIAGVSMGDSAEALAVLRSGDFSAIFIEEQELMPILLGRIGEADDGEPRDIRDAIKYFVDNVRSVSEDRESGLIALSITWTDRELAARWANLMVQRLNDFMRERALKEAETNLAYLEEARTETSVVVLQQSIGRLVESELQKLMLARGNEEFAFKVVDSARVPKTRSRPRRTLTVVLTTFVGGALAVFIVMVWHSLRRSQARANTANS